MILPPASQNCHLPKVTNIDHSTNFIYQVSANFTEVFYGTNNLCDTNNGYFCKNSYKELSLSSTC